MAIRTFRGRDRVIGPAFTQPKPIPVDPVTNEGGIIYVEDGLHYFSDGTEWVSIDDLIPEIRAPRIIDPDDGVITSDLTPKIVVSEPAVLFAVDLNNLVREFQVQFAGGDWSSLVVDESLDQKDYQITQTLAFDTAYEVRVRDVRTTDNTASSWSNVVTFTTTNNIERPTNQIPADGATDVENGSDLVASPYNTTVNTEAHQQSQFQIELPDGTNIWDSGLAGPVRAIEIPANQLAQDGTQYRWRVRYQGASGVWSEWSLWTTFESLNVRVKQPTNLIPNDGDTDTAVDSITLQSSAYDTVEPGTNQRDPHVASDWVMRDAVGAIVFESRDDSLNLESIDLPSSPTFPGNEPYTWQVRHRGSNLGWSEFSQETSFTPFEPFIEKPVPQSPTGGVDVPGDELFLQADPFTPKFGSDTHVSSDWQLREEITKQQVAEALNVTSPLTQYAGFGQSDVEVDTLYEWRARYNGQTLGSSAWSDWAKFRVPIRTIAKPTNEAPPNGKNDVDINTVTLESSAFQVENGSDTHLATQWEARRVSNNDIEFSSGTDETNLTFINVAASDLPAGVELKWRVRHLGNNTIWSEWSDYTTFTPIEFIVQKPTNVSPADGETGLGVEPTLEADAFSTVSSTGSHNDSEWEITDVAAGTVAWSAFSGTNAADKTSIDVPESAGLQFNTTEYSWRVRYQGSDLGWSEWSDPFSFTTADAKYVFIVGESSGLFPIGVQVFNTGDLSANEKEFALGVRASGLVYDGTYIYVLTAESPTEIKKIKYSDTTLNQSIDINTVFTPSNANDVEGLKLEMSSDGSEIFVLGKDSVTSSQAYILKFLSSDLSLIDSYEEPNGFSALDFKVDNSDTVFMGVLEGDLIKLDSNLTELQRNTESTKANHIEFVDSGEILLTDTSNNLLIKLPSKDFASFSSSGIETYNTGSFIKSIVAFDSSTAFVSTSNDGFIEIDLTTMTKITSASIGRFVGLKIGPTGMIFGVKDSDDDIYVIDPSDLTIVNNTTGLFTLTFIIVKE